MEELASGNVAHVTDQERYTGVGTDDVRRYIMSVRQTSTDITLRMTDFSVF